MPDGDTRQALIDAALATLRNHGHKGATSRTIARTAGVNQALVFYHFGSVNGLLLAALDQTGEDRLARYRDAVAKASSFEDLLGVAIGIYREDLDEGHMTVVAEMMAAGVSDPELRPEIVKRAARWTTFVEDTITPLMERSPFGAIASARDVAFAVVAFYAGINLFTRLQDDHEQMDRLFETAGRFGPLLAPFFAS